MKNKSKRISNSESPSSSKKIKLDKESEDSNSNSKKFQETEKIKSKKKKETSNDRDSDDTITSVSNSDSESVSSKREDKRNDKVSENDSKSDKSDVSLDSHKSTTLGRLVIDLDSKSKKKMQSVASLVNLGLPSDKELEYRKEKNRSKKAEDYSKMFKCAKCSFSFEKQTHLKKMSVHPLLGILMCTKCCDYYGDGDFSLDSDDEDKYCRWCGEGGTIFSCSKCICAFCKKCISKHFGKKVATEIENEDDWLCYFCNMKPLWELRYICSLAQQKLKEAEESKGKTMLPAKKKKRRIIKNEDVSDSSSDSESEKKIKKKTNFNNKSTEKKSGKSSEAKKISTNGRDVLQISGSSTSDESDNDGRRNLKLITSTPKRTPSNGNLTNSPPPSPTPSSSSSSSFSSQKQKIVKELENILKLTEYQMSFGSKWSTKKLALLARTESLKRKKDLKKECEKIKWFISTLCSYLVGFANSIDSIEKTLNEEVSPVKENTSPTTDPSYASILKFLSFTAKLVKVFDSRSIDFEYLLNSALYEDDEVLGLQKKPRSPSPAKDSEGAEEEEEEEKHDAVEKNLEVLFNSSAENTTCIVKD